MSDASIVEAIKTRLERLNPLQLNEVERLISRLEFKNAPPTTECYSTIDWPHAPLHRLGEKGVFIVTGGTLNKMHYFKQSEQLDIMQSTLLELAKRWMWQLEAWACFSNHYHFIARADEAACKLDTLVEQFHSQSASKLNALDAAKGRKVWFNYFDTELTFQKSYFARLNYVHQNAVRHRLVTVANQYKWCSAAWFEQKATPAQVKTIYSYKTDRVSVPDDYEV